MLVTGLADVRRVTSASSRWQAGWAAAAAAETLFIRAVIITFWYTPGSAMRQPNWGPPALSAGSIAAGIAMIATLTMAAARPQAGRVGVPELGYRS